MLFQINSYTYDLCYDGLHYLAICQRTGRAKKRLDRRVWVTDNGKRVTDESTLDALEVNLAAFISLTAPRKFAPFNGQQARRMNPNSARPKFRTPRESKSRKATE